MYEAYVTAAATALLGESLISVRNRGGTNNLPAGLETLLAAARPVGSVALVACWFTLYLYFAF
jgi:hypothetical protein